VRVLIVDDEPAARRRLAALLEDIDPAGIEIVGEAGDGLAALDLVRERRPDLLLLDIAMREVDGFDVARHLTAPRPLIVFQTAHQRFALEAFDHDALDFVVKPVQRARLAAALERARVRLAEQRGGAAWDRSALERAGAAFGYAPPTPVRLLVRHGHGHRLVPLADITRLSAGEGVVYAHTPAAAWMTDYTLNEIEARTSGQFIRTSRADLVNAAHVDRIVSNGDGSATLTMTDGRTVRVSRRRSAEVKARLES
jgi:two-component system LytT family response regulator